MSPAAADAASPWRAPAPFVVVPGVVVVPSVVTAPPPEPQPAAAKARPNPTSFSTRVDNQWFPLLPGTRWVYTGVKDGKPSRDVMVVTHKTRTIEGVPCVVVHDRLYLRGRIGERTTDWYSQDSHGNVWYFGEKTATLNAHGHVTSTEGTWMAGVDGAQAGIYIPGNPRIGNSGDR